MRGSIRKRYPGSWTLILELGYQRDPETGSRRRKQKWIGFRGTKREAENRLNELIRAANHGEFVERSTMTLGEWLADWLETSVKPSKRPNTYKTYKRIIDKKISDALKNKAIQKITALDLERFYAEQRKSGLSSTTLAQYHALLHSALRAAASPRVSLVTRNVAAIVEGKPRINRDSAAIRDNCWDAQEAAAFLRTAREAGAQAAALYALALDAGPRKGELCGLKWEDIDLEAGTVSIVRQLLKTGHVPTFVPIKNDMPRTVDLGVETIELLKVHKRHQAELKMANRTIYRDHGLVFCKECGERRARKDFLGDPLQTNNLGEREFLRLIKAAQVKRISIHGLRHTSATLLLKAGVPAHVVQQRLGHKRIEMTLGTYAHALPSMQKDAARRLSALLHG